MSVTHNLVLPLGEATTVTIAFTGGNVSSPAASLAANGVQVLRPTATASGANVTVTFSEAEVRHLSRYTGITWKLRGTVAGASDDLAVGTVSVGVPGSAASGTSGSASLAPVALSGWRDIVKDYGCVTAGVNPSFDNTSRIQAAIDDAVSDLFAVIYVPPGLFRHHGVSLALPSDGSVGVHIQGAGRRLSKWQCLGNSETNIKLGTAQGNSRDTTISDMTFTSGATAVELSRASYNIFRNCTFEFTKTMAVTALAASNNNTFENCWWVHNSGESLNVSNGLLNLVGCTIGEDSGHILNNGLLNMVGCQAFSSATKLEATGPRGMGRGLFYNTGNGTLVISGGNYTSNFNMFNMRFSDRLNVSGARLSCADNFLTLDDPHAEGSGVNITGCNITIKDGGALYARNGSGAGHLTNSVISGNVIELDGPDYTVTVDDALLDPQYGNIVVDNLIRRKIP